MNKDCLIVEIPKRSLLARRNEVISRDVASFSPARGLDSAGSGGASIPDGDKGMG